MTDIKEVRSSNGDIDVKEGCYDNGNIRYKYYYVNSKLHREDGPAIIKYYDNGNIDSESYYRNGRYHREDGPANIKYYDNGNIYSKSYYINGGRHREDGPAYIEYYRNGNIRYKEYWVNERELTEKDWYSQVSVEAKLKIAFGLDND
jgi:antitoxin component YwqK of YwqJK toxin-antitoxin module